MYKNFNKILGKAGYKTDINHAAFTAAHWIKDRIYETEIVRMTKRELKTLIIKQLKYAKMSLCKEINRKIEIVKKS